VTKRRLTVRRAGQLRDVLCGRIIERLDLALGERDSDEHGDDRLRRRVRNHPVFRRTVVLVALGENGVALQDQQPCGAVARQVVVQPATLGLVGVTDRRLGFGALQRPCLRAVGHLARWKDFVVVAHRADEAARLPLRRRGTDRITLGLAERLFVGRGDHSRGNEKAREKDQQPYTTPYERLAGAGCWTPVTDQSRVSCYRHGRHLRLALIGEPSAKKYTELN
jgi:hypothetical protein